MRGASDPVEEPGADVRRMLELYCDEHSGSKADYEANLVEALADFEAALDARRTAALREGRGEGMWRAACIARRVGRERRAIHGSEGDGAGWACEAIEALIPSDAPRTYTESEYHAARMKAINHGSDVVAKNSKRRALAFIAEKMKWARASENTATFYALDHVRRQIEGPDAPGKLYTESEVEARVQAAREEERGRVKKAIGDELTSLSDARYSQGGREAEWTRHIVKMLWRALRAIGGDRCR